MYYHYYYFYGKGYGIEAGFVYHHKYFHQATIKLNVISSAATHPNTDLARHCLTWTTIAFIYYYYYYSFVLFRSGCRRRRISPACN